MGRNKQHLSETELNSQPIFPGRMICECDETIHLHWQNFRLEMSDEDFTSFANMILQAYSRYKMQDLHTKEGQHIELARSKIKDPVSPTRFKVDEQVNLYKELRYDHAEFYEDDTFVVLRLRDLRIEMSKDEFKLIADAIKEGNEKLS